MQLKALFRKHAGSDIYVVGTGPSSRLFPTDFFDNKIAIGLNQAYRRFNLTYTITVHPELEIEYRELHSAKKIATKKTQWIVKRKAPNKLPLHDATRYVFSTSYEWRKFAGGPTDTLFLGKSVCPTAIDMAIRMGAKNVILVGVDMAEMGGDHHATDQHVQFHNLPANDVYLEYRLWAYKARKLAREKAGVTVLSLTPLLGCGGDVHQQDYVRLRDELLLKKMPAPLDISKYDRPAIDLP